MSKRAYKHKFYPTDEKAQLLAQTFGYVRMVYNTRRALAHFSMPFLEGAGNLVPEF